ncbi:MAG: hypothetical protein CMJ18_01990 [Phycisphaeraceae bacterium]|nr:hypothetical protein [Phycisphaeraceae bacterium]
MGGSLLATAVVLLLLLACEHARTWRDTKPWSARHRDKVADPEAARLEMIRRGMAPPAPRTQSPDAALAKTTGCVSCHGALDDKAADWLRDDPDMHLTKDLALGCTDCHGGDATVMSPLESPADPHRLDASQRKTYRQRVTLAHVLPRNPAAWYGRDHLQDERAFGAAHHHEQTPHGSRNPENTYAALNHESPEFIRFVNPGDLRIADWTCGACHPREVTRVRHSMMAHGSMLWAAVLYNNGSVPHKQARYGESYSAFGVPQRLDGVVENSEWDGQQLVAATRPPTRNEVNRRGILPRLEPLPVWNITQPGNILRVFERGGRLPIPGGPVLNPNPLDVGNRNPLIEGGRPDKGLSPRGLGTLNRTDPVFLGIQKTRLLDPNLYFLGTNDHPGDYRSSGCTACHTPYANDRDPAHSGRYAAAGHEGGSQSTDPTIAKDEPGHPIRHAFTSAMPSSQCVVCHVHPGTSYANTYYGTIWWDNESDGAHMYPRRSQRPTPDEQWRALRRNPESAQLKGLWGNLHPDAVSHAGDRAGDDFLERSGAPSGDGDEPVLNDRLRHNQFADFHGHGWMFRGVYKKDRRGNLLTRDDAPIDFEDPHKWKHAVHLQDVHLDKGMHCVDCHFVNDVHGDGRLYGEVRNAVEITCVDCHGTYWETVDLKTMKTSGPAAPERGTRLRRRKVWNDVKTDGLPRGWVARFFKDDDGRLWQRSALNPAVQWEVPQTADTINPESAWAKRPENVEAAKRSRYAKTVRTDGTWGDLPPANKAGGCPKLAHGTEKMECYTCHTSWMTSCFGCHLPMQANERTPTLHNENLYARNFTRYNYQVLRDEIFMLGRDGAVRSGKVDEHGNAQPGKIVPVRSSSAVVVSSRNQSREWIYHQQQTISGEGYSGQAFNPHFPHATSGRGTTRKCSDCHLSSNEDNNAWLAQLLTHGTNFVNFFGRYVYVATGRSELEAVAVTEHDEPQAVYGSDLHRLAYPDEHAAFEREGHSLDEAYHHGAGPGNEILDLQLRGEYVYAARGRGGLYVYDVANIDNKGFSERIVTAPVSPLGQSLSVPTRYAVAIGSPTLALDPARTRLSNDPARPAARITDPAQPWHMNQEQAMHPLYAYLVIGDREEGLVLTFAATLLDGDPTNNFLERATLADGGDAFNPDGALDGLTHLAMAGRYAYVTARKGLAVVDLDDPLRPNMVAAVGTDFLQDPVAVAVQFRYAFVTDREGLKVIDVTDPTQPRPVAGATVPLDSAHRLYVARTYAFVAGGSEGLVIIDVANPRSPSLVQKFTADGAIDDARDVKVGMTNASLFAYVADGRHGLRVIQLMGPETTPQFRGFSPPLDPRLIATRHTHGPALAISKGLDRDRAVDESGNQLAVFGRWGSRPLNLEEQQRLYLRDGKPFTVDDEPGAPTRPFVQNEKKKTKKKRRRRPGRRR